MCRRRCLCFLISRCSGVVGWDGSRCTTCRSMIFLGALTLTTCNLPREFSSLGGSYSRPPSFPRSGRSNWSPSISITSSSLFLCCFTLYIWKWILVAYSLWPRARHKKKEFIQNKHTIRHLLFKKEGKLKNLVLTSQNIIIILSKGSKKGKEKKKSIPWSHFLIPKIWLF